MRLCRCDMCKAVADIGTSRRPYEPPPSAPKGWAAVTIIRERSIEAPAPVGQRLRLHSPEGVPLEATVTPTGMPRPDPITFHVATELQLCPKCIESLLRHPALLERIAADDTRTESMALRGET